MLTRKMLAHSMLVWPQHMSSRVLACTGPCPAPLAQVTATNVDIARVAPKWHLYTPEEVEEVISRL